MDLLPSFGVTWDLAPYAVIAAAMVVVEVYVLLRLLPRSGGPPALASVLTGASVLLGSAAFLLSILELELHPTDYVADIGVLWAMNLMMFSPPGIWVIAVIAFHDRPIDRHSLAWPALLALAGTVSEVLMGLLFSMDPSTPALSLAALSASLTSPWFFWSMATAMIALLIWVRPPVEERRALWGLALSALLGPWITFTPLLGGILMAGAMGVTFGILYRELARRTTGSPTAVEVALGVATAFLGMSVGAFYFATHSGDPLAALPFGGITAIAMSVEFAYLVRRGLTFRPDGEPAVDRPSPAWSSPSVGGGAP